MPPNPADHGDQDREAANLPRAQRVGGWGKVLNWGPSRVCSRMSNGAAVSCRLAPAQCT